MRGSVTRVWAVRDACVGFGKCVFVCLSVCVFVAFLCYELICFIIQVLDIQCYLLWPVPYLIISTTQYN